VRRVAVGATCFNSAEACHDELSRDLGRSESDCKDDVDSDDVLQVRDSSPSCKRRCTDVFNKRSDDKDDANIYPSTSSVCSALAAQWTDVYDAACTPYTSEACPDYCRARESSVSSAASRCDDDVDLWFGASFASSVRGDCARRCERVFNGESLSFPGCRSCSALIADYQQVFRSLCASGASQYFSAQHCHDSESASFFHQHRRVPRAHRQQRAAEPAPDVLQGELRRRVRQRQQRRRRWRHHVGERVQFALPQHCGADGAGRVCGGVRQRAQRARLQRRRRAARSTRARRRARRRCRRSTSPRRPTSACSAAPTCSTPTRTMPSTCLSFRRRHHDDRRRQKCRRRPRRQRRHATTTTTTTDGDDDGDDRAVVDADDIDDNDDNVDDGADVDADQHHNESDDNVR
jgi:hypothetical protein